MEKLVTPAQAFILAGGQSSRMGTDKAMVPFRGMPMMQHGIQLLSEHFSKITIVSNHEKHKMFGLDVIPDAFEKIGPLGGIIAGLRHSTSELNFFMACDMPLVPSAVIVALLEQASNDQCITTSFQGSRETLCTLYPTSALPLLETMAIKQQYRLHDVLIELEADVVDVTHLCENNPFININTPAELQ
ncbi:MAG: molybdenum cofactor guanylyltransferase [Bacteroidota bacterium]|jgi:molybdopterin-guanine dinucleotide biosynthesis protein A